MGETRRRFVLLSGKRVFFLSAGNDRGGKENRSYGGSSTPVVVVVVVVAVAVAVAVVVVVVGVIVGVGVVVVGRALEGTRTDFGAGFRVRFYVKPLEVLLEPDTEPDPKVRNPCPGCAP